MHTEQQYIGPFKVAAVVDLQNGLIEITYEGNNYKRVMPKKTFELLATPAQSTFDDMERKKFEAIKNEIIPILAAYDFQLVEFNRLIGFITSEVQNRFNRATNYAWTKDDTRYIAGSSPDDFFTFGEAVRIIETIPTSNADTNTNKE